MVRHEQRIAMIRLYETIMAKIKTNEGWSKDMKCNIEVKQGCPLFPALFGIFINKLEECLETAGCKGTELASIIVTLLLYADDIILTKKHDGLDKKTQTLHVYFFKTGMTVNTDKTKVMTIKSKMIAHGSFVYDAYFLE